MRKRELLLKKIKENNGIITTKEALNLGIHKDVLKELTIKEELEKEKIHYNVSSGLKNIQEADNLAVGRLVQVKLTQNDQSYEVPVRSTCTPYVCP